MKNKPTFLGVGAQKCATTWISECLREHPQIYVSSPKEIHYFSYNLDKGDEWYESFFCTTDNFKQLGEFSTSYFNQNVAEKIYDDLGTDIKIIILIRDPIERFKSHWKHYFRDEKIITNYIDYETFNFYTKKYPELIYNGKYTEVINKYINLFGNENTFVISKHDIDNDSERVFKDLCKYLEVNLNFTPNNISKKISPGIIPKNKKLESIRKKLFSIAKKRFPFFINFIKKSGISEKYRKINSDKNNNLIITKEVYKELLQIYSIEFETVNQYSKFM